MKLVISGASGKTGYRTAEEALKSGHKVHLLIRKNSVLPASLEKCTKTIVDLGNNEELDKALQNRDALVIATGARPSIDLTGPAKVDAFGVKSQIESCKRVGLNRVVLVSSLCAGKWLHPLNLFGLILIWKKIGEDFLRSSNLDWTIIRPGGLLEKEESINKEGILYSEENTQEEGSIPRRLVAKSCVEALKTPTSIGKILEITSSTEVQNKSMKQAINAFSLQKT